MSSELSRLNRIRLEKNLTYAQMGQLVGVNDRTLYRILTTPHARVHDRTLFKIQKFLGQRRVAR